MVVILVVVLLLLLEGKEEGMMVFVNALKLHASSRCDCVRKEEEGYGGGEGDRKGEKDTNIS